MAKGSIKEIVGSGNNKVGFIDRTDVVEPAPYIFKIPDGLFDKTYVPAVGHAVTFTPGPGHTTGDVAKEVASDPRITCTFSFSKDDPSQNTKTVTAGTLVTVYWTSSNADTVMLDDIKVAVPSGQKTFDTTDTAPGTYSHILKASHSTSGAEDCVKSVTLIVE